MAAWGVFVILLVAVLVPHVVWRINRGRGRVSDHAGLRFGPFGPR